MKHVVLIPTDNISQSAIQYLGYGSKPRTPSEHPKIAGKSRFLMIHGCSFFSSSYWYIGILVFHPKFTQLWILGPSPWAPWAPWAIQKGPRSPTVWGGSSLHVGLLWWPLWPNLPVPGKNAGVWQLSMEISIILVYINGGLGLVYRLGFSSKYQWMINAGFSINGGIPIAGWFGIEHPTKVDWRPPNGDSHGFSINQTKTCEDTLVRILWHFETYKVRAASVQELVACDAFNHLENIGGYMCQVLQELVMQVAMHPIPNWKVTTRTHTHITCVEWTSCSDMKQFLKALFCGHQQFVNAQTGAFNAPCRGFGVGHWGFQRPLNSWMPSPTPMVGNSPRGYGRRFRGRNMTEEGDPAVALFGKHIYI